MIASVRRFCRRNSSLVLGISGILLLLSPVPAIAVSCTMQGKMTDDQRNALLDSSRKIALAVQSGDSAAVKAMTIPSVAANFGGIANSIEALAPKIKGASITVDDLYALDASDLTAPQSVEFFCSSTTSPSLQEEVSIPDLPPGKYGLALVHATGVEHPQQMGLLLSHSASWQLAGFFFKPMLFNGHDSVWYWTRARQFAQKKQEWNAHFYYQLAVNLASPVSFLITPNFQKLRSEQEAVKASGLPTRQSPLVLTSGNQKFSVTDVHPDDALGSLDLVVNYDTADVSDPAATRTRNLAVMKALLALHPGLRDGFHGLWVFANAPGQQPFGIEQPMSEIQ